MYINFSGVESMYKNLENGTYDFRIKSALWKTSARGNNMLEVQLREEKSGAVVFDYFVITQDALFKLKEFLQILGEPHEGNVDVDENRLLHRVIRARTKTEKFTKRDGTEGESAKISFYLPPQSAPASAQTQNAPQGQARQTLPPPMAEQETLAQDGWDGSDAPF